MIQLREATDDDILWWMQLRNIPEVYAGFYAQNRPLEIIGHAKWWYSRNHDWRKYIIELDGERIGVLNIGQLDHWSPEIGYAIHPDYWGKGYGKEAVKISLDKLKELGKDHCHTTVLKDNERSLRLLKSLGFTILGDAREGEVWLQKKLR